MTIIWSSSLLGMVFLDTWTAMALLISSGRPQPSQWRWRVQQSDGLCRLRCGQTASCGCTPWRNALFLWLWAFAWRRNACWSMLIIETRWMQVTGDLEKQDETTSPTKVYTSDSDFWGVARLIVVACVILLLFLKKMEAVSVFGSPATIIPYHTQSLRTSALEERWEYQTRPNTASGRFAWPQWPCLQVSFTANNRQMGLDSTSSTHLELILTSDALAVSIAS